MSGWIWDVCKGTDGEAVVSGTLGLQEIGILKALSALAFGGGCISIRSGKALENAAGLLYINRQETM